MEVRNEEEHKLWLTYWVIFGLLFVTDNFIDILSTWIPLYFPLKVSLLLYLQLPQSKGAALVYDKLLRSFLVNGESAVDEALNKKDK